MNQPALFAEANALGRRDVREFANEFSDEILKMSGRCIDIGSGPGDSVVDFILPKLPSEASLVCSDISEKMMNFAKERYKDNHRVSYIQLNIESPDLPDDLKEQFDHVTSLYCLHWVQGVRQALENMRKLVRPGGTVLMTCIATTPVYDAWKHLAAVPRYQPYTQDVDRYISVFQYKEQRHEFLKNLLKEVGFEIQHYSIRENSHIFDNPRKLKDHLLSVNPFVDRMPAEVKEQYAKDMLEEIGRLNIIFNRKNDNDDEYSVLFRYRTFRVYLKKPLSD